MGVLSYLNIKRPATMLWRAFSPGRDAEPENDEESTPPRPPLPAQHLINIDDAIPAIDADVIHESSEAKVIKQDMNGLQEQPRKISDSSTSSGVSDMSANSSLLSSASSGVNDSSQGSSAASSDSMLPSLAASAAKLRDGISKGSGSRPNSGIPNSALLSVLTSHFDVMNSPFMSRGRALDNKHMDQ